MSILSQLLAGSQQEELHATAGLAYLLNRGVNHRRALIRDWERNARVGLTDNLSFATEVKAEEGRCDIAGYDSAGSLRLLVEGKFWAGLTDHQPNAYLSSLRVQEGAGLLLFVAPSRRLETLWSELCRRARVLNWTVAGENVDSDFRVLVHEGGKPSLALTSWSAVLNTLSGSAMAAGDSSFVEDVRQLSALCDRMDTSGFLPLSSIDLGSHHGRRRVQFIELISDLRSMLVERGVGEYPQGMKAGSGWWPLRLKKCVLYLRIWDEGWAEHRETPFWLVAMSNGEHSLTTSQLESIGRLQLERPPRLVKNGYWWHIPLFPKTGAERAQVLDDLFGQVQALRELL